VYPNKIKIVKGTVSEQLLSVLGTRDQSVDANDWDSYREIEADDDGIKVRSNTFLPLVRKRKLARRVPLLRSTG
jgi:hypothetical protein